MTDKFKCVSAKPEMYKLDNIRLKSINTKLVEALKNVIKNWNYPSEYEPAKALLKSLQDSQEGEGK